MRPAPGWSTVINRLIKTEQTRPALSFFFAVLLVATVAYLLI